MENINEQISRIKTMMGLNEDGSSESSGNATGTTKHKWESGVARSGPANPIGNAPSSIRTNHGRGNPIELAEDDSTKLESFAETRLGGAEKIADNAKEKGGAALLTYHHFEVKLPYYEKAAKGELNMDDAKKEYKDLLEKLYTSTKDAMDIEQIDFQELVGKIEVLGELIIKENEKGA
jgi:polyhydroxyalkanoate synthesis regulator phasin